MPSPNFRNTIENFGSIENTNRKQTDLEGSAEEDTVGSHYKKCGETNKIIKLYTIKENKQSKLKIMENDGSLEEVNFSKSPDSKKENNKSKNDS